jgi:undecaprenyl-diphosphatase
MGWYVILGTIPISVLGLVFENQIDTVARDLRLIAATLIVLGIILLIADQRGTSTKKLENLNFWDAMLFGASQAMALIPGVSRSGATITAGLFLGYDRASAARYSFLLSIPAIVASGLFKLKDISATDGPSLGLTLLATVLAFVSGYASISWLLRFVSTRSYFPFVVYRVIVGLLLIILLFANVLHPTETISNQAATVPTLTVGHP